MIQVNINAIRMFYPVPLVVRESGVVSRDRSALFFFPAEKRRACIFNPKRQDGIEEGVLEKPPQATGQLRHACRVAVDSKLKMKDERTRLDLGQQSFGNMRNISVLGH